MKRFMSLVVLLGVNIIVTLTIDTDSAWAQAQPQQQLQPSSLIAREKAQGLTEDKVIQLFRADSVAKKNIEAQASQARLGTRLSLEPYQARFYSQYNFSKSNEKPLIQFQPVFSPYEDWVVGVEKKLPLGVAAKVEGFGTKWTADGFTRNATQAGGRIGAEIDLWQNIFGRLDRAQMKASEAQKMRADIQRDIQLKKIENDMRKIYWNIFTVAQSINLSQSLVDSAQQQLADARRRQQVGAADAGEVARYQSQLESRRSSVLLFQYEQEKYFQILEQNFKDFRAIDWKADLSTEPAKKEQIAQCIRRLRDNPNVDLQATPYDELIGLLQFETENELKVARSRDAMKLSLVGQYQSTGIGNSYDSARDNLEREKSAGHLIGLRLSIPLGRNAGDIKNELVSSKKNSLEAQRESLLYDLRSQHETILKSVYLLDQGLARQEENSRNLKISYNEMNRKYKQGRVTVVDLINEQDAVFQSELRENDLRRQVAFALLDYFSVFTKYPCGWNQL